MTIDSERALARLRERLLDDVIGYGHARQLHPSVPFEKHRKPVEARLVALLALNAAVARAGMPCVGYACGKTPPGRDTPLPLCRSHRAREAADRLAREALEEA